MIEIAHSIIREQIRKFNGGYKSPEEIDNALYRSEIDLYNSFFYPLINKEEASFYLKEQSCNISSSNVFDLNADYSRYAIIKSLVGSNIYEGPVLEENEYLDRVNSLILAPDLENPIARIVGKKIEFYPSDAGNFVLSYYRSPSVPKYGYNVAGNGRDITYDAGTSTDLDIRESSLNTVIVRALGYLGISLEKESLLIEKQVSGN